MLPNSFYKGSITPMSKSEKAQLKMKTANHLFGKYD
jgi:hypothetical protein